MRRLPDVLAMVLSSRVGQILTQIESFINGTGSIKLWQNATDSDGCVGLW